LALLISRGAGIAWLVVLRSKTVQAGMVSVRSIATNREVRAPRMIACAAAPTASDRRTCRDTR
jgi:hypothetical protein